MKLHLQSERFAPTGNLSGAGIQKSLGAPTLNKLRVLVREACQNAWDAQLSDTTVTVRVHLRPLTRRQHHSLQEALESLPHAGEIKTALAESLSRDPLWVLEIGDYGTRGLCGPVRADSTESSELTDFISFFRNIGSPRDRVFGGGTYGYGKSALYNMSRCRTILAYSETTDGTKPVARFMGSSIGHPYKHDGAHYTGRHWWGEQDEHHRIVDPLIREPAHRLAHSLGLGRRSREETGTTLLLLDPDLGQRTPTQAINSIRECLGWFFWPKMLARADGSPSMKFEVLLDGSPVALLQPESTPGLQVFTDAMQALRSHGSAGFRRIRCGSPIKDLGRLGLAKRPRAPRAALDTGEDDPLIPAHCSHVALMRPAELVVRYVERPALPSDMVEFGGVFICDEDVEQHFADSEPPAHDDWLSESLGEPGRRFVRVALRRIKEATDEFANPSPNVGVRPEQKSLAKVADLLGGVLIGQDGGAPGTRDRAPRKQRTTTSRSINALSVSEPESFRLAMVRRLPCALFQLRVALPVGMTVQLHAEPLVVMEGGSTTPAGPDGPHVVGWLDANGVVIADGPDLLLTETGAHSPLVAISVSADCAVSVAVLTQGSEG